MASSNDQSGSAWRPRHASMPWLDGHRLPGPIRARFLLLAMVCLAVAACGGSGDDTSGAAPATTAASATTAAASQACADAAALKASVAELDQLDPPQAGKAGIQAALEKISTNLNRPGIPGGSDS